MWHLVEYFAEMNLLKTSPKKEISLLVIDQESLNIYVYLSSLYNLWPVSSDVLYVSLVTYVQHNTVFPLGS